MTEHNSDRPLTRREMRELRMRQEAEAQAAAEKNAVVGGSEEVYAEAVATGVLNAAEVKTEMRREQVLAELSANLVTPTTSEDGTPLTRREIRQLRNAELERLLAEYEAEHGPIEEPEPAPAPEPEPEPEPEAPAAEATPAPKPAASAFAGAAAAEPVAEPAAEPVAEEAAEPVAIEAVIEPAAEDAADPAEYDLAADLPATQALSLEEIAEAEGKAAADVDPRTFFTETDDVADDETVVQSDFDAVLDGVAEEADEVSGKAGKKRGWLPWKQSAAEVEVESIDEHLPENEIAELSADIAADEADVIAEISADDVDGDLDGVDDAAAEEPAVSYSFPDITPLEEERSVFDDNSPHKADTGFDNLITKAVSDEGGASTSSASALILPESPVTQDITNTINATGQIYVSGGIQLPKSYAETGGHDSLQDFIGLEDDDHRGEHTTDSGTSPVSALSAVSSQHAQGAASFEKSPRDKSKKPLLFAVSGGVLVLISAGVVYWGATQGLFG